MLIINVSKRGVQLISVSTGERGHVYGHMILQSVSASLVSLDLATFLF